MDCGEPSECTDKYGNPVDCPPEECYDKYGNQVNCPPEPDCGEDKFGNPYVCDEIDDSPNDGDDNSDCGCPCSQETNRAVRQAANCQECNTNPPTSGAYLCRETTTVITQGGSGFPVGAIRHFISHCATPMSPLVIRRALAAASAGDR